MLIPMPISLESLANNASATDLARVSAIRVIVFDRAISSMERPLSTCILHVNVTRPLYTTVFLTIMVVIAFTWRSRDPSCTRINAIRIARRIVPMEFFLRNCLAKTPARNFVRPALEKKKKEKERNARFLRIFHLNLEGVSNVE